MKIPFVVNRIIQLLALPSKHTKLWSLILLLRQLLSTSMLLELQIAHNQPINLSKDLLQLFLSTLSFFRTALQSLLQSRTISLRKDQLAERTIISHAPLHSSKSRQLDVIVIPEKRIQ